MQSGCGCCKRSSSNNNNNNNNGGGSRNTSKHCSSHVIRGAQRRQVGPGGDRGEERDVYRYHLCQTPRVRRPGYPEPVVVRAVQRRCPLA